MEERLRTLLAARIRHQDIPLFGIAPVERWTEAPWQPWMPEEFYPQNIWPECRSVIVIGYPISLPVVETTPSNHYHEMYKTVNTLLDQSAYRISLFLNREGHAAFYIPRDGYGSLSVLKETPMAFFSHRHAAYLAGLGTFGWNNMLLTKQYGPRVRFTSIFTSAELPSDPILKRPLCLRCHRCVDLCPVKALQAEDYPLSLTDKERCRARSEALLHRYASPCGICIKVCPVGEDRKLFHRTDMGIYNEDGKHPLHRAWDHVRRYGSKQG